MASRVRARTKAKGPASYFPSIEKTYGHPVSHWFKLLGSVKNKKHMDQVAFLKSEHKPVTGQKTGPDTSFSRRTNFALLK